MVDIDDIDDMGMLCPDDLVCVHELGWYVHSDYAV